jgi:molybdenum cofactor cytidylyltransferase
LPRLPVTGAEHEAIADAVSGYDCRLIHATDWQDGVSASIRAGVAAIGQPVDGLFLFLGDMPLVPVQLCDELTSLALANGYAARPISGDVPGHPVCFVERAIPDLLALTGDAGAGALLRGRQIAYLPTAEIGATLDVDTPADLAAAQREWKSRYTSA